MTNVIKRTTLMVRDMDRSLEFYVGVLGMKVWFDRPFTLQGGGLPIGKKGDKLRLVILMCENDTIGMIGLMEFLDPVMTAPEITYELGYGRPVFVVVADDAQAIYDQAVANKFKVRGEPNTWSTTGAKGETKHFLSTFLFDPDGHFFECNQVTRIEEPA